MIIVQDDSGQEQSSPRKYICRVFIAGQNLFLATLEEVTMAFEAISVVVVSIARFECRPNCYHLLESVS
jgi:hypothetical protein